MQRQIRAFIAVETPEAIRAGLDPVMADLSRMGTALRRVQRENLHFTIKFLGEISPDLVDEIGDCMSSVRDRLGFEIEVKGLGAFPSPRRPRVLWVGVLDPAGRMIDLARTLDERLTALRFGKEKSYVPHLTLARSRSRRGAPELIPFIEERREIEIGTMRVDRMVLKKSVLTPKGPIYTDLLTVEAEG